MTVTTDDVKKIYPTTYDLSGYLATAQVIVNTQLLSQSLDPSLLDQITIYLAAHFAVIGIDRGGLRRKRMGESDESYKTPGDLDQGFKATLFGQQAMLLDTSGTLASLGAKVSTLPGQFGVIEPDNSIPQLPADTGSWWW